ncbi:MAG TPA: HEAT repeat domain-containing protein [Pyrinomonadaceae bacterium]|nr:HEAT repeat domain-containing protein [Pyrinomonadaceae bacterium]
MSVVGIAAQPARDELTPNPLIRIMRFEDQRNWNDDLKGLLSADDSSVRQRAALAAGRIGDARAIPTLADMVLMDRDKDVRQMAAFALGEIELPGGAYALTQALKGSGSDLADPNVRARAVEALGKIVAAMPNSGPPAPGAAKPPEDERLDIIKAAIVNTLRFEEGRKSQPDRLTVLLALTAVLRSKPDGVGPLVAKFLDHSDPEIVATALNTMARLRLKDANERVRELLNHSDPMVRANAARVIGAAEHKEAFDAVLDRALKDPDVRVRASAIRALASLKDARAADPLIKRGNSLLDAKPQNPAERNELLEIATTLGRVLTNSMNADAIFFLRDMHARTRGEAVEVEVAFARIAPGIYLTNPTEDKVLVVGSSWRQISRRAQGLAAIREVIIGAAAGSAGDNVLKAAQKELATMLDRPTTPALAVPDVLQAYASYKTSDADRYARQFLGARDVIVRSTSAELLGNQSPSEINTRALVSALPRALRDRDLNDAALAILDALGKQKNQDANDAIKTALNSDDHLIRRKAVALLKANGVGDLSDRIGLVKTRYTDVDYRRAMARIGKKPTATIVTSKGSFTIEFLPDDAPMTVDNFMQLAKRGYFNGQTIPRVVPNFVVQAGDPRGDQNGGPGYQIRCEINEVPYERAAVGMALSGKDTGGSQWFVTHSPQPHLDGGYTVFGRVIRGMDIVDNVTRGDVIRRVIVNER